MAAAQYIGVGGVARKVKAQYIGVSGAARKVKNGYIGVGGVARKFYTGLDIKPTLADNDWATISAVSEMGAASTYWSVGDEKDITLTTGETLTMVILGFGHDDLASGGKAGVTFGMKHLMADTHQMNTSNSNSGGFTGSAMYSWLQDTLVGQLPTGLKNVAKDVNKKTSAGSASSLINTDTMKLFLFSEVEVFGSATHSAAGEGAQYSYFATNTDHIKKMSNGTGVDFNWWLRSPRAVAEDGFVHVTDFRGLASIAVSTSKYGICFGFCV